MSVGVSLTSITLKDTDNTDNDERERSDDITMTSLGAFSYIVNLSEDESALTFITSDPNCVLASFSLSLDDLLGYKINGDSEIQCYVICRGKNYEWKLLPFKVTFIPNSEKFQVWKNRLQNLEIRPRKLLFIVNPVCGKKTAKNYFISRVEPLLKTLEYDYKVIYTTRKDEATEICSKLREDNEEAFEGVVVLSGDGTLNEALKGLMSLEGDLQLNKSPLPVGIVPCGTSNTLAYTIHGTEDQDTALLHVLLGDELNIDVLSVADDKDNLIGFSLTMVAFGFIADAIHFSEKFRSWLKDQLRYTVAFGKVIMELKKYNSSITMWHSKEDNNGQSAGSSNQEVICGSNCSICSQSVQQDRYTCDISVYEEPNLFFANFYNHSGRCRLAPHGGAPHAHIGDGLLHIRLAGDITRGQAANVLKGSGDASGPSKPPEYLIQKKANKVKFQHDGSGTKNGCLILDGEVIFANEVTITCHHQALRFFGRGREERLPDQIVELTETEQKASSRCKDSCTIL